MSPREIDNTRVHDLLRIDPAALDLSRGAAPLWVRAALASCPWVVVRRAPAPEGQIAVGVRGATRDQRWGTFCNKDGVCGIVRPEELLALYQSSARPLRTPALRVLREIDEQWADFALQWGPGGSVGFELATRRLVTTDASDLDLILYASQRMTKETARSLWERTVGLAVRVDVRIEAPECACSLEEYARELPARIVLRYADGPRLGADPWGMPAEQVNIEGIVQ